MIRCRSKVTFFKASLFSGGVFILTFDTTTECRFNTDSPNVVHMTVKPQEVVDEEDASKAKAMGRDGAGSERTAGCRCTIM